MHPRLAVAALQVAHPWAWGLLLGIGYFIGELPNSFFKRQLGIAPGAIASGASGAVFWVTDQLDSVAGVLLALSTVWRPDVAVVVCIVGLALLLHPLVAALMVMLGLKDRIG
jgi:CDP-diglyceride synthetase